MPEAPITREQTATLASQIYAFVRACPAGRVTTYGWLGAAVGYPRGARMVGWIMNATPQRETVPAHRVINSKGELSGSWAFGQKGRMRQLLEAEGIVFDERARVNLKRYGWDPQRDLTDGEREHVLATASGIATDVDDELMRLLLDDPASPFRLVRDASAG
jgi:methylated-DNA-protein-cysteine methyltransferase-like protein